MRIQVFHSAQQHSRAAQTVLSKNSHCGPCGGHVQKPNKVGPSFCSSCAELCHSSGVEGAAEAQTRAILRNRCTVLCSSARERLSQIATEAGRHVS